MQDFQTLSEAMNALRKDGYTEDFNLQATCLVCKGGALQVSPEDFAIDSFYRFEGMSDPADSMILYAISSEKHGLKGLLVNGFGVYSDDTTDALIEKLNVR